MLGDSKEQDAEFVAAMEDLLFVYHRPYNTEIPVICMDEKPHNLPRKPVHLADGKKVNPKGLTMNTNETEPPVSSCSTSQKQEFAAFQRTNIAP